MCRLYNVRKIDMFKKVCLPLIIISINNILSSTISLIFKVVIAGEVYAQTKYGIGSAIQLEKMKLNTAGIITWIIIIAIITIVVDRILKISLKNLISGRGRRFILISNININYGDQSIYKDFNINIEDNKVNV